MTIHCAASLGESDFPNFSKRDGAEYRDNLERADESTAVIRIELARTARVRRDDPRIQLFSREPLKLVAKARVRVDACREPMQECVKIKMRPACKYR